jgi:multiple sugar transport system permease protein
MSARQLAIQAHPPLRVSAGYLLRFILLVILGILWAAPTAWMLLTSLKPEAQAISLPPAWLPNPPTALTLDNYATIIFHPTQISMVQSFENSVIVATLGTLLVVTVDCLAAYALARLDFVGRQAFFALVIATLIIPGEVLLVPVYVIVWHLGWLNDFRALIVPPMAGGFGVFLLRQFFIGIPQELEDAARIDGCSRFRIFHSITLPLARGAVAALAIFTFLGLWNEFTWPYIVINDVQRMTLPIALLQFRSAFWSAYGQLMAGTAIAGVPAMIVFLLFQRAIIQSITLTGIKG